MSVCVEEKNVYVMVKIKKINIIFNVSSKYLVDGTLNICNKMYHQLVLFENIFPFSCLIFYLFSGHLNLPFLCSRHNDQKTITAAAVYVEHVVF